MERSGTREYWDKTWRPYCLECTTMDRMKCCGADLKPMAGGEPAIQRFKCQYCGATHERQFPMDESKDKICKEDQ